MTLDDIAGALREAHERRTPVRVKGGGTLERMGNAVRAHKSISCAKLNRLLAHEHADLTCSVQSGMTLEQFARELAARGQFVALDAPHRSKATVGGTLAAGWLGPRRHYYGRSRDFTIGSQAVLADGTIAAAGGMVVKNVSGYDMTKLYIGSFGTLGVIVRANFKTLPLPRARRLLVAKLPEDTRRRAASQIAQLSAVPSMAVVVQGFGKAIAGDDGIDGRMLVMFEGTQSFVERATRDARSVLGKAGVPESLIFDAGVEQQFERVLDACVSEIGERSLTIRSIGKPSDVEARSARLRDAARENALAADEIADVMNGDVYLQLSARDARTFAQHVEAAVDALRAIDARCTIVAGRAPIRESLDAWGSPPAALDKMRALKAAFDPHGILNPGCYVGGI